MKKIMLIAAVAGLSLVAAAPPAHWNDGGKQWTGRGYPPCSRTVTDRCIQLYERGVATRANLALNEELGMNRYAEADLPQPAVGGPYRPEPRDDYGAYDDDDYGSDYGDDYAEADMGPEMESAWSAPYGDDEYYEEDVGAGGY